MSFHDVLLPTDISYGSRGGPQFSTRVTTSLSGFEQRNINWQQARCQYNLAYGVRTDAQLEALLTFFRARQGKAYGFRYKDWGDYTSCPLGSPITATDQVIGTGDDTTTAFQLQKTYSSGGIDYVRPISKPETGTVKVSLLDSELLSGWSVNLLTGVITFDTAPASGVSIKAGFAFHVPVRFDTDTLATTLETYGAHAVADVPVVEIR